MTAIATAAAAAAVGRGAGASRPEKERGADGLHVVRASSYLLVLVPIRLGLGIAGLVAAWLADVRLASAAAAFALGAVVSAVALAADRRFSRDRLGTPDQLPEGADRSPLWRTAVAGVFPSTAGVVLLAGVALFFNAGLAALLAGIVAGMGVAGAISWMYLDSLEGRFGYRLYLEQGKRGRVFATRR